MGSVQIDIIENTSILFHWRINEKPQEEQNKPRNKISNLKANLTRLLINLGSTTAANTLTTINKQKQCLRKYKEFSNNKRISF